MRYALNDVHVFPSLYLGFIDPTDNYCYTGIPTTDGKRSYQSIEELMDHIEYRRESMGYSPIPHLSATIQHYLYLVGEAPKSYFHAVRQENDPLLSGKKDASSQLKEIQTGAALALSLSYSALSNVVTAGSAGWTTNKIATERAEICYNCPENAPVKKSVLTKAGQKALSFFSRKRTTPFDDELNDCGICGCPLKEKVHYSEELIVEITSSSVKATDFPESFIGENTPNRYRCWMHELLKKRDQGKRLNDG